MRYVFTLPASEELPRDVLGVAGVQHACAVSPIDQRVVHEVQFELTNESERVVEALELMGVGSRGKCSFEYSAAEVDRMSGAFVIPQGYCECVFESIWDIYESGTGCPSCGAGALQSRSLWIERDLDVEASVSCSDLGHVLVRSSVLARILPMLGDVRVLPLEGNAELAKEWSQIVFGASVKGVMQHVSGFRQPDDEDLACGVCKRSGFDLPCLVREPPVAQLDRAQMRSLLGGIDCETQPWSALSWELTADCTTPSAVSRGRIYEGVPILGRRALQSLFPYLDRALIVPIVLKGG